MKKAFTMMELIFVIVVIGILAAVIMPRTGSNRTAEAAVKLVSDIRYAQHLAMIDDKFDSTVATWYENLWQIRFNGNIYSIVSDNNTNPAADPMNRDNNITINLNDDYGVTLNFNGTCGAAPMISFDHVGRPMIGDLAAIGSAYVAGTLMPNGAPCAITLTGDGETVIINVEPETGYAHIMP